MQCVVPYFRKRKIGLTDLGVVAFDLELQLLDDLIALNQLLGHRLY